MRGKQKKEKKKRTSSLDYIYRESQIVGRWNARQPDVALEVGTNLRQETVPAEQLLSSICIWGES